MSKLVTYSDSESEDGNKPSNQLNSPLSSPKPNKKRLPTVSSLFNVKSAKIETSLDGRQRTVPHKRGNWATHIFLQVKINEKTKDYLDTIVNELNISNPNIKLHSILDESSNILKISLSKTWYVPWSFHSKLIDSLRFHISLIKRFSIKYSHWTHYSNEEKTRNFLSLDIHPKLSHLKIEELGKVINKIANDFHLPEFYKPPKFHSSVVWYLPNEINNDELCKPPTLIRSDIEEINYLISSVYCTIGQNKYEFKLI